MPKGFTCAPNRWVTLSLGIMPTKQGVHTEFASVFESDSRREEVVQKCLPQGNAFVCNAAISACKAGQWQRAIQLLREMQAGVNWPRSIFGEACVLAESAQQDGPRLNLHTCFRMHLTYVDRASMCCGTHKHAAVFLRGVVHWLTCSHTPYFFVRMPG